MADRQDLREYAREQTLLDTTDVADAVLNTYLDRAIGVVADRFDWPWLDASTTVNTVVGQQNYSKPTDHVFTHALVESGKNRRLREITPVKAWQRYGDAPPTQQGKSFYFYEDKLWIAQIPPAVVTYKWFYRKSPTLMTADNKTPEWDSNHHWFLAEFVIRELWRREEDQQAASAADQAFEQGIGSMAQFYINEADDQPAIWGEDPDRVGRSAWYNMPWMDGV